MNITIKSVKQVVLLLSACLALSTYSMEQESVKVDETPAKIRADCQKMVTACKKKCSVLQDIISRRKCSKDCMNNYSEQLEYYFVRKYTSQCAGQPFDEKWRYKPGERKQGIDIDKTSEAYDLWEDPNIRVCAKRCLAQYDENAKLVLRDTKEELKKDERDCPVTTMILSVIDRIRGTNNS